MTAKPLIPQFRTTRENDHTPCRSPPLPPVTAASKAKDPRQRQTARSSGGESAAAQPGSTQGSQTNERSDPRRPSAARGVVMALAE